MARPAWSLPVKLSTSGLQCCPISSSGAGNAWNLRRQVAASIGEMPAADRIAPATTLLTRDGKDPIVVDATISSLKGLESEVLTAVTQAKTAAAASPTESVSMLTAAVAKSGDVAAVQKVIDLIADASHPAWQRQAMLQGLDAGLPALGAGGGGGRGNRGGGGGLPGLSAPGGRVAVVPGRSISLPAEPVGLTKLAAGSDEIARLAKNVSAKLDWPGRPAPVVTAAPLTAEQQKRFDAGAEIYKNICMGCHQEDGRGKEKLGAKLTEAAFNDVAGFVGGGLPRCGDGRMRLGRCRGLFAPALLCVIHHVAVPVAPAKG